VVEARARPGTSPEVSAATGYVSEEVVITAAAKAGFVLEARSQLNANPHDTKDRNAGDETSQPSSGADDRARDTTNSESDCMTLRFRKPSLD
jgi:predicted methyltransferase